MSTADAHRDDPTGTDDEDLATGHPSQAEGEDGAGTGEDTTESGHPSQAEGEDPDRPE